jgi:hypothetical protein
LSGEQAQLRAPLLYNIPPPSAPCAC